MGRSGGFFKRLKAKEKRAASRRSRGTKGASKEERRLKHNERVDYYAAKREAEELAAISSSSDDNDNKDEVASTDSEAEARRQERSLLRLRQLLGVTGVKRSRADMNNGKLRQGDGNNDITKSEGNNNSIYAAERTVESSEDDDWRAYLFDEETQEEEMEGSGKDRDDDEEEEDDAVFEGESDEEEQEDDDEESDEASTAKEEEYDNELDDEVVNNEEEKKQRIEETRVLLPQFRHGVTCLSVLRDVVRDEDPWFVKYHLDGHGKIDKTLLRAIQQERKKQRHRLHSSSSVGDDNEISNITIAASDHAVRFFLHPPFVFKEKEHQQKPPYMHRALWEKWLEYCAAEPRGPMTVEERGLLDLLQGYADVMDCCRSWNNADSRREIYLLHVLNHWFKARTVVLAHDAFLVEQRKKNAKKYSKSTSKKTKRRKIVKENEDDEEKENAAGDYDDNNNSEEYELRDRGFGKTRIIIMLPMRNIAHNYVTTLVKLLRAAPENCTKLSTFNEDFTELEEAVDPTFKRRPREYQRQFAGNIDDSFCVGVRLEPNSVRVYTHPLNSDLIICSPLGLRRRLERNGDALVSLASIEVCLIDEAHVLLMQNWQHVSEVLRMLNKRPTDTTYGLSDLRRVYAWALAGRSGRHRQTVISTNITNAVLLATFRSFVNNSGRVLLQLREEAGVLAQVMVPVRQHFLRFDPGHSLETCDDARFEFFTRSLYATKIAPLVDRDVRTIIFVPSYFDFVRLRNYMIREHRNSFAAISEYTSISHQRKALGQFTDLERPLLLVTERFYFFKRYFVKLAEVMVFYSPPIFPAFYTSLVGRLVASSPNAFALTLFCRFDTHELNRLVGTRRTRQLLEREADAFSFVTN